MEINNFTHYKFEGWLPNDWEVKDAADVCIKITDGTHDTPKVVDSGIPFITAIHVKKGKIDFDNCLYISEEEHEKIYKRCNPSKGDLLVVNIGAGVAEYAFVETDKEFSLKNVALLKPNSDLLHDKYLCYHHAYKKENIAHRVKSGGAQPFLSLKELRKLKIVLPPLPEQQKIAKILSTWDKAIDSAERLIANSKQQKKALMQQLLTGKKRLLDESGKRFDGEWEEVKLGDISNITTGSSNRADSSLDAEYAFFDRSLDVRRSSIYLFDSEAVIVAGEGQEFVPKHFIGKFDLHQRTYAIMDFKNTIGKFLYYYITFNRHYFLAQAVGSTVKSLRLPMFVKMPIKLPSVEEQQKIAAVLTNADKEIELLEQQLADLQQEKKALMQVLLTGKKRVLVDG